jgi:hypothetical protein
MADRILTSRLIIQAETAEAAKAKASRLFTQVEYVLAAPGTYYGEIDFAVTLEGQYSQEFVYSGEIQFSTTFESDYYKQAANEKVYIGEIDFAVTLEGVGSQHFVYNGSVDFAVTFEAVTQGDKLYEGCIDFSVALESNYYMPIPGFDQYTGYGLVNVTFLDGTPPYFVVSDVVPLTLQVVSIVEAYREFSLTATGGLAVSGAGAFATSKPPSYHLEAWGGVTVEGAGTKAGSKPQAFDVIGRGGSAISGAGVIVFTGFEVGELPVFEVVASGGVALSGRGTTAGVKPETFAVVGSGGPQVSGKGTVVFTGVLPGEVPTFSVVASGGVDVSGEGTLVWTSPGLPLEVTGLGGPEIGGVGAVVFTQPHSYPVVAQGGVEVSGGTEFTILYVTWVFTRPTFEPAVFSNFGFNSYGRLGDKYLAAKDDGIYLLEGETDDGAAFHPGVVLGPSHLGTQRRKRVRAIYLGHDCAGAEVRIETESASGQYDVVDGRVGCAYDVMGTLFTFAVADFEELDALEVFLAQRGHG